MSSDNQQAVTPEYLSSSNISTQLPVWYWIVAGLALVWNLLGVAAFLQQINLTSEDLAQLPQAEQALYAGMPLWVNIAFALSVFAGALGCVGLLMRKSWAFYLFVLSLLGVSAQMYYSIFISHAWDVYGPGEMVMPIMIIFIAIGLILFSKKSFRNAWVS